VLHLTALSHADFKAGFAIPAGVVGELAARPEST
jgi:hypothetical protein